MMDKFPCETDVQMGKILKYRKINPVGEDIYLNPDGTITKDEDKIIAAQRIFKHNYYKSGGKWAAKNLPKYEVDK
jgi:hypothetical protein